MGLVQDGKLIHSDITLHLEPKIEKGPMTTVHGIVVHQTGGSTANSAFASYEGGAAGAHFLIDLDGKIYQTARVNRRTWHVGKLKARCVAELRCTAAKKWDPSGTHQAESKKSWPDRYPSNDDSIGVELVGAFSAELKSYQAVTAAQNTALKWLVAELQSTLSLAATEVFRHPDVSYKEPSEAQSADWK